MNVTTIVLIPGLWMTALSWEHWVKHYTDKGYCVIAANWPGMEGGIEQLRRDPSSFANLGLTEVVDHYEQIIGELETPPIIIGYGFGGLIAQVLLDRGWGVAGVAIASAPVKGIARLPLSMLKLAFSVLGDSFNSNETTSLTPKQFHRAFANSLTESESLDAFKRYIVPAPNRVLLQTAFANFTRHTAITVNFRNDTRAPLLLVAGGKDRIVPSSIVRANFDLYRESNAETDYKEFSDQAHFTLLQETKVADYALGWALCRSNGSKLTSGPDHTDTWSVQLST
ncbi:MAG TPA: alpha/beta hydrolase [Candidatus Udaeobacter sp.]|nr:alpha/beta hydrolase [Candidatus Udaeobacter sp.]